MEYPFSINFALPHYFDGILRFRYKMLKNVYLHIFSMDGTSKGNQE